jgi:L-glutamine-phosphate cytidylyltransferase
MKCVIVAAGSSTRLRPLTDTLPKCLLPIRGKTILARAMEGLLAAGITQIAIVVGFQAEKIHTFLREKYPNVKTRFILNPNFALTNNAYSLLLAREFFLDSKASTKSDDHLLILDSDIIFHPGVLRSLEGQGEENRIAVRVKGSHDMEEVRVSTDHAGTIDRIGKEITLERSLGESVGIERFNHESAQLMFEILVRRVERGAGRKEYYEMSFQEMIDLGVKIKAVDVSDFPVIEIDTPPDLELAEQVIVPSIEADTDVRVR